MRSQVVSLLASVGQHKKIYPKRSLHNFDSTRSQIQSASMNHHRTNSASERESHLSSAQESSCFDTTPRMSIQPTETRLRSPPPFRSFRVSPQDDQADENMDLFLPIIPDNLDDDYLFSSTRAAETSSTRRTTTFLPFRPKHVAGSPLASGGYNNFIFVDAKMTNFHSRTLLPLLDENSMPDDDSSSFFLPMKNISHNRSPVMDGTC